MVSGAPLVTLAMLGDMNKYTQWQSKHSRAYMLATTPFTVEKIIYLDAHLVAVMILGQDDTFH